MDYSNLIETQTDSKEEFKGKLLHVFTDTVKLPNSTVATREYIKHVGAVAIVPLTSDNRVIVEKQFRYPLNNVIIEIPAGKLNDKQEDRLSAAKRELKEETGLTANEWIYLGDYYPAAAYSDEIITLYLAKSLVKGQQNLDEDEFLELEAIPISDLINQIMEAKIGDGKTQVAILKTAKLEGLL